MRFETKRAHGLSRQAVFCMQPALLRLLGLMALLLRVLRAAFQACAVSSHSTGESGHPLRARAGWEVGVQAMLS